MDSDTPLIDFAEELRAVAEGRAFLGADGTLATSDEGPAPDPVRIGEWLTTIPLGEVSCEVSDGCLIDVRFASLDKAPGPFTVDTSEGVARDASGRCVALPGRVIGTLRETFQAYVDLGFIGSQGPSEEVR